VDFFPAFLDLQARSCLLVGGGRVALRKARLLVSAGATLTVVSPQLTPALQQLVESEGFALRRRHFRAGDVEGHWLVVSATGDPNVERAVFRAATDVRVFCNAVDDTRNSSYITPAIVDRGKLVVAVSTGGAAPVLARRIREQIEQLLPMGMATLVKLAEQWRARVTAAIKTSSARRRFWESVFDGPAASQAMRGNISGAQADMAALLRSNRGAPPGEVWLVGAGPGDPGLLTIQALQILQKADVIVYDRLVSADILALSRRDADLVAVGKKPGGRSNSQEQINALLVSLVRSGQRICRLKGGDPFIFGRGGEERDALLRAGFACQIVPGITAAAACAASAGIPLTQRGVAQSVVLIAAHGKDSVDKLDWPALARSRQTLAFYMAVKRIPQLMNALIDNGMASAMPIAIIEKGTTPEQRVLRGTLGQLAVLAAAHRVAAPAILIVGKVAALGAKLAPGGPRPAEECATYSYAIARQG
jgi:uroporphyrin-III C-methyltransferase/precorrin-2 dehydrogenase/sirohydrochlorin ferrochelatase